MRRFMTPLGAALATLAVYAAFAPNQANAQYVQVPVAQPYPPTVVVPAYYSAPVYTYPPVTTYSAPMTTYSAPITTYSAPVITSPSYYPSTISYYPSTVPVYTYSAPAAAVIAPAPGVYTTRTYYGLGIFRPRGYYSETTYAPIIR